MATVPTQPGDLTGLVSLLGKITALDMTATSSTLLFTGGQNTSLVYCVVLRNFSSFPVGTATPATWACSFGTNSSTAPTNMRAAAVISGAPAIPAVLGINLSSSTITAYVPPRTAMYFAITTTTNGLGTFDVEAYGIILPR